MLIVKVKGYDYKIRKVFIYNIFTELCELKGEACRRYISCIVSDPLSSSFISDILLHKFHIRYFPHKQTFPNCNGTKIFVRNKFGTKFHVPFFTKDVKRFNQ